MGEVNSYRDLLVWEQAIDLATAVYRCTRSWPKEEMYGLTQQARRAAVSVPAELETHLIIAHRAGVADEGDVKELLERCESVGKLLRRLIRKLGETQSAD